MLQRDIKKKVITDFCFQLVKETSTEKSLFPIIIYINSTWEEWKWKLNHDNFIEIFALSLGFGRITKTTAEIHDKTIAYTSQLAHVASSAYIKSPAAQLHAGFSAGSFKDLTRVAYLNESMWSQLFLENKEFLVEEIDILLEHLTQYRDAIKNNDRETLFALLKDGKEKKVSSESEG